MNRMTTTRSSKQAPLNSGTLSPNPWDLSLSGQNADAKLGGTRTEGRAPQGCDLSAVPSAEMATGGLDAEATQTPKQRPVQTLAYCGQKMVLTMGSTLRYHLDRVVNTYEWIQLLRIWRHELTRHYPGSIPVSATIFNPSHVRPLRALPAVLDALRAQIRKQPTESRSGVTPRLRFQK